MPCALKLLWVVTDLPAVHKSTADASLCVVALVNGHCHPDSSSVSLYTRRAWPKIGMLVAAGECVWVAEGGQRI